MSLYVDVEKTLGAFRLSVRFQAGNEVFGILGASGCGKSMTLKTIAGIEKPDRGRIVFDDQVLFDAEKGIDLAPQKRQVGLLFQNYALFPNMTVEKNLLAGARASKEPRDQAKARVADMMDRFYLTGLEKHRPHQLSGGQQQRAALARILLTRPRLLMLDEPFCALDGYLSWKLELELMDLLKDFGCTALFVSHKRDEIYRLCQRACVMDGGISTPAMAVKTMFEEPGTLAVCRLSGCKNYSSVQPVHPACKDGGEEDRWVYASDWGTRLNCGRKAPPNTAYIGVRSHDIHVCLKGEEENGENVIPCRIIRVVEDLYHMVVMAVPLSAAGKSGSSQIRLEMPKERWNAYISQNKAEEGEEIRLRIAPRDILLLKR